jgi:hypothetical protein
MGEMSDERLLTHSLTSDRSEGTKDETFVRVYYSGFPRPTDHQDYYSNLCSIIPTKITVTKASQPIAA